MALLLVTVQNLILKPFLKKPHTRVIENIHNYYQHYFLIKEKEKGFIIKPYVETLKGKLILTESEPVYLRERSHGKAKVSMIIPAYNAEDYIAIANDLNKLILKL